MRFAKLICAYIIFAAFSIGEDCYSQSIVTVQNESVCLDGDGNKIDISNMTLLRGSTVSLYLNGKKTYSLIEGQTVYISDHEKLIHPYSFYDIPWLVTSQERLDLDIHHARMGEKPIIFWKETFKHKANKQGVFDYRDGKLIKLCEGYSGSMIMP